MSSTLQGLPVTNGVAIGPYLAYDPLPPIVAHTNIAPADIEREKERLQRAIQASVEDVTRLRDHVQASIGEEEAAIFDAHLMMFEDESLLESTHRHIENDLMNTEWAIEAATDEIAEVFANLEDEYFRARATDILDIRTRILNHLQGRSTAQLSYLKEPVIILARDLLPSDTAGLDTSLVLGLVTEQGGPTSHTAILARQLGIPAVVGVQGLLKTIANISQSSPQKKIAFNGTDGEVVIDPDISTLRRYEAVLEAYRQQKQELAQLRSLPSITSDGVEIELAANIGRTRDAQIAVEAGASGVGLFRTEFLFLDRDTAPSEDEQLEAYTSVLQAFHGRTVIVRTLDIGGDKSIPYLTLPHENNPFLGLRGIRLCLAPEYQSLFRTQVRALLLAAQKSNGSLWVMFPMICDLRELRQAKAFFVETEQMLLQEGCLQQTVLERIPIGIMIETPAAAWLVDQLAQEANFFSIGTNDLAQYTLASDRMNASLAELHRPFHPAVMRTIAHIVRQAKQHQRWIGMCGEMAGNPRATAFLLGIGIDELSMEAGSLNEVKQVVRRFSSVQVAEIVEHVLAAESSLEIAQLLVCPHE